MCKVSIIVPCYKQAEYLSEALNSVLAQTFKDWECIIVNDGSPDNTEEIAVKYCEQDSRFKYIWQKNQGPAIARNTGIGHSSGKYILPLDADDIITKECVQKYYQYLESNSDVKLVYCNAVLFNNKHKKEWTLTEYKYEDFIWSNCIFNTTMYRKSDCEKAGGYSPNVKYGLEDWDFYLRLLNKDDKVHKIDDYLFYYRRGNNSIVTTSVLNNKMIAYQQVCHNNKDIYMAYCDNILFWHYMSKKGELYESILNSHSYRLGNFLLTPFIWLKKQIKGK